MKACWGNGGVAPLIELGTRWRWVASFTPRQFYPRHPLDRRLGGPQSQSWHGGEEKNSQPRRESNLRTPSYVQPLASFVAVKLTSLFEKANLIIENFVSMYPKMRQCSKIYCRLQIAKYLDRKDISLAMNLPQLEALHGSGDPVCFTTDLTKYLN
jgi:hypothetical protein